MLNFKITYFLFSFSFFIYILTVIFYKCMQNKSNRCVLKRKNLNTFYYTIWYFFIIIVPIRKVLILTIDPRGNNNNNNNNNTLHLYSAFLLFLGTQRALHCEGVSSHPPLVCSIHLDDEMAAIVRQTAPHTPAYWRRGDSDEANQCMGMIRRP